MVKLTFNGGAPPRGVMVLLLLRLLLCFNNLRFSVEGFQFKSWYSSSSSSSSFSPPQRIFFDLSPQPQPQPRLIRSPLKSSSLLNAHQDNNNNNNNNKDDQNDNDNDETTMRLLTTGILASSFSDGIVPNPHVHDFLMAGLVQSLLAEKQRKAEYAVEGSVVTSPCNGPNISALNVLESMDAHLATLQSQPETWKDTIESLLLDDGDDDDDDGLELRVLYIPTAMYALRADSQNTPGKQRQRARADGKSRRNEIVNLLKEQLNNDKVSVLAVTLDFDDGSVKQPEGSDDNDRFPKNGKDAIRKWNPNLIYVQGGNTFWLYHCIEKGGWTEDVISACTGPNAAVYCGTSAGAIIMGERMETACWKGWDDPSVVPGMETYEDWKGIKGLGLSGGASFFPHMTDQWLSLVRNKKEDLVTSSSTNKELLYCLRDEDVCCINGNSTSISIVTAGA